MTASMHRFLASTVLFGALLVAARPLHADGDPIRQSAADHFDRAYAHAQQGDHAAALAEFRRALELSGQTFILFNMACEYADLNHPVEAVKTFDKLFAGPGNTPPDKIEEARRMRGELAARIGQLKVTTSVPAAIEVDNLAAEQATKDAPIEVGNGMHVVAAVAAGYAPLRQQIDIAGGETREITLVLLPTKGQLAQIRVTSSLTGAEVLVDGALVGRTPLPASLPVEAGSHEVSLRRAGYQTAKKAITLGEGSAGEVALEMETDPAEIARLGGVLVLDGSEPGSSLSIDGRTQESATGEFRLAPGPHRLVIAHSGFLGMESEVTVESTKARTIHVDLEPTTENRQTHLDRVSGQRWRAWGTLVAGALVTGGGLWYLHSARTEQDQANRNFALVQATFYPGGACYNVAGNSTPDCQTKKDQADSAVSTADHKVLGGYVATGVGAAVVVTGLVLVLTTDDVSKFQPRKNRKSELYPSLSLAGWAQPGSGGVLLGGRF
jgi:hypothetical protein